MSEISSTFKNLKNAWVLVPNVSSFNSLLQVLQKPGESWRMSVNNHEFNQAVGLIAAAMPDVVLLLEQSYTASGRWQESTELANAFFSIPVKWRIGNSLCSLGLDNSIYLQSIPSARLTLLLLVII